MDTGASETKKCGRPGIYARYGGRLPGISGLKIGTVELNTRRHAHNVHNIRLIPKLQRKLINGGLDVAIPLLGAELKAHGGAITGL